MSPPPGALPAGPEVRWVQRGPRPQAPRPQPPFQRWNFPDGSLWAEFYREPAGYLLRFPDLADFEITADGCHVDAWSAPGVAPSTVEHLFLNQAEPLALGRQGHFVLHASAVDLGDHAVAFLGASGRGKSTLAASFALAGARFMTDDGLRVLWHEGRLIALPSHPTLRLWQDSQQALAIYSDAAPPLGYTAKQRLMAGNPLPHGGEPRPLRAFYFLGECESRSTSIEPARPAEALLHLVRNSFLLDIEEREMLTRHFDELSRIAVAPVHFQLEFPRRYDVLPEVREAVMRHAAALPH